MRQCVTGLPAASCIGTSIHGSFFTIPPSDYHHSNQPNLYAFLGTTYVGSCPVWITTFPFIARRELSGQLAKPLKIASRLPAADSPSSSTTDL
ncbi:hypothetical protein F4778DRAFT_361051 [Xylariomycetidae sp. FL2044]|nr:hypothetical protein F4778DRAFT_361051 [Xylariomycetidae sp. FL2044]